MERVVWIFSGRKNEAGAERRVLMIKGKDPRIQTQSKRRGGLPDSYIVKSVPPDL